MLPRGPRRPSPDGFFEHTTRPPVKTGGRACRFVETVSGLELVAESTHGDDPRRMRGILFDLRAQPLDVDV